MRIEVRAKPRAKQSRIVAVSGNKVDVSLAAPPVDGAANDELVRFLAEVLGLPKRSIRLVRGETSRTKLLEIDGIDEAAATERLQAALGE